MGWFIDNTRDGGLFRSVETLSAQGASEPPVPGGSTIAAHVEHLRWTLTRANAFVRGEQPSPNWEESWSVRTVDQAAMSLVPHAAYHLGAIRQMIKRLQNRDSWRCIACPC